MKYLLKGLKALIIQASPFFALIMFLAERIADQ